MMVHEWLNGSPMVAQWCSEGCSMMIQRWLGDSLW